MANRPNGSVQVSCAPSAEVNRLGSSPRNLEAEPDAEADQQARHDQARDREIEQHARARKRSTEGEPGRHRDHDGQPG